jgi:integrase
VCLRDPIRCRHQNSKSIENCNCQCKTEASQKPVVIDEHIACALITSRQESMYTAPDDWIWASPNRKGKQPLWLSTIMRYYIQPAVTRAGIQKKVGWHTFRHTFSSLVKSLGVDAKVVQELVRHASFGTTMDCYTQAFEAPKREAQQQLAALIMRTGEVCHARLLWEVVEKFVRMPASP